MERSLLVVGVSAQISVLIPIVVIKRSRSNENGDIGEELGRNHPSLLFAAHQNRTISGE